MTDAPERIWAWARIEANTGVSAGEWRSWDAGFAADTAEYVRADTITALREDLREAREALCEIKRLGNLVARDLNGRVEAGKVAAVKRCADIASEFLAKTKPEGAAE